MKIFIIHKGMDVDYAYLLRDMLVQSTGSEVLVLENGGYFWKIEATKLIRQAQLVLVLNGPKTSESPYIGWEIKKAISGSKQIYFLDMKKYESLRNEISGYRDLPEEEKTRKADMLRELEETLEPDTLREDNYPVHEALKHRNSFTKEYLLDSRVKEKGTVKAIIAAVNKYIAGEYDIFNDAIDSMDEEQLFEQYKIYLATSESLVARRQSVSTFYTTVNSVLVTGGSVVCAFFGKLSEKMLIMCTVAVVGIILGVSWYKILEAYGILNASKMKIVRLIEKKLPISLYDKEWDVMSDKLNGKKYVSFTDSEKRVPILFIIVYLFIIAAALVMGLIQII